MIVSVDMYPQRDCDSNRMKEFQRQEQSTRGNAIIMVPLVPDVLHRDEVTVVAFGPNFESLDTNKVYRVEELLFDLAKTSDPPLLVVDLVHTKFLSSACINALVQMSRRIRVRKGGRLAVTGLTPYCLEVLKTTRIELLMEIFRSIAEAVEALKPDRNHES